MVRKGAGKVLDFNKVYKVSNEEMKKIIEERKPLGMFYRKDGDVYVAVDNRTGHAWTEEFKSLNSAKRWLIC